MDQLPPQAFLIRVLPLQAQVVRVRVSGEVDLCTALELERALVQEVDAAREVLLDLSAVSFIDSSGCTRSRSRPGRRSPTAAR